MTHHSGMDQDDNDIFNGDDTDRADDGDDDGNDTDDDDGSSCDDDDDVDVAGFPCQPIVMIISIGCL